MASYTHWINFNKGTPSWTQFYPSEKGKATKKRPDMVEFYREGVEEIKILRKGNQYGNNETVYDTLETWYFDDTKFDDEIEIEIYRGDRTGTLYYAGYFSISDTTLNKEYKTFKVTPRIDDNYRDFIEGGEAEYDIFGMVFSEDVYIGELHTLGAWTARDPAVAAYNDFDTFTGTGGVLTSVIDNDGANVEARHQSLGALTDNLFVVIKINSFTLNGGTGPWIDIWDVGNVSRTDEGAQRITDTSDILFTIENVATAELFLVLHTTPQDEVTDFAINFELIKEATRHANDGILYMDFIEEFITGPSFMFITAWTGNIKSTFINNDALPSDAPSSVNSFMTTNPNGNYASGATASNPLNEFLVGRTFDFVDADASDIFMSLNQIMSDLKEILQAGWYIDADGDFRIEHIEYFEKLWEDSTALDITGAAYDKYKPETDAQELNFNKALLANREQFRWAQVGTAVDSEDFVGVDITYENLETISNVLKHEPRNVTTDMQYLRDNASEASGSGLVYLLGVLISGDDYYVDFEEGVLSTDDVLNGHFSWANLQDKYWTWRRMSENGDMNDGDTIVFDSAVKFLQQPNVRFGYQSTLDGFKKITTGQGTGQQIETIRDLESDFLTILIAYNPY